MTIPTSFLILFVLGAIAALLAIGGFAYAATLRLRRPQTNERGSAIVLALAVAGTGLVALMIVVALGLFYFSL